MKNCRILDPLLLHSWDWLTELNSYNTPILHLPIGIPLSLRADVIFGWSVAPYATVDAGSVGLAGSETQDGRLQHN